MSEIKAKGGKVESQSVAPSVLLKTGKVSSSEALPKREVVKPDGDAYSKAGKDVVNAKA